MSDDDQRYDSEEGSAGTADPTRKFRETEVSEEEQREIEEARRQRLDPANRPENAEVDNTHRTFDPEKGQFVDSDRHGAAADR